MRVSKDIFVLLVQKYFDLETQYQCQYVCQLAYSAIPDREKAREHHINLRAQKKHKKHYLYRRKLEIKIRITSVPKDEKKTVAKQINEMLLNCPTCHQFIVGEHICDGTLNQCCQWCGTEYYCLRGSEHWQWCSFPVSCKDYTITRTTCDVTDKFASTCSFIGNQFRVRWHFENECVRICKCCDEPFSAKKIHEHVIKCFASDRLPVRVDYSRYWRTHDKVKYGRVV